MRRDTVWFHAVLTTYGAWVYGDGRGFRTRHHREHVEGDYKRRPAAGFYASQEKRSRRLLKQEPVMFPAELRKVVGEALQGKLAELGAWLLIEAVGGQHVHLLVKLPAKLARQWLGKAKMHTSFELKKYAWTGKVWAVRCRVERIRNKAHQVNAFRYIQRHEQEGAWVGIWKTAPGCEGT